MIKSRLVAVLAAAASTTVLAGAAYSKDLPLLNGVKRILFLGDSITYAGGYVDYIQAYLETHCADHSYDIIDMGLPSETVSGLSEPGHAGGAFPRPVLSERLDRVLSRVKPDLVFACYGMNDGIYYPFSEDRFSKYRAGIQGLVKKVTAAKAHIVLITPPPFDASAIKGQTLPAGLNEYRQPFEGYDDVLGKYSDWLVQQGGNGWQVVDIHTPINQFLADQRKLTPDFHLAGDGVHINAMGHWLIADQILTFLGAASAAPVIIDARLKRPKPDGVTYNYAPKMLVSLDTSILMPIDPALNLTAEQRDAVWSRYDQRLFRIKDAEGSCMVTITGTDPKVFSRKELEAGVSLLPVMHILSTQWTDMLLPKIHEVRAMLTDAWLTEVGHKRPGMAHGLPISQAMEKGRKAESEIKDLVGPIRLLIHVQVQ